MTTSPTPQNPPHTAARCGRLWTTAALVVAASALVLSSAAYGDTQPVPPKRVLDAIKLPRGVEVMWKLAWDLGDCTGKEPKRCATPSRYRVATAQERKAAAWKKTRRAARALVGQRKLTRGVFYPLSTDDTRYVVYLSRPGERKGLLKEAELKEAVKGAVVLIRKEQPKPKPKPKPEPKAKPEKTAPAPRRALPNPKLFRKLPYKAKRKPKGLHVFWNWSWYRSECEDKKRPQCVPPSRYRRVTPADKDHPSWKGAVLTARYLLSGSPPHGAFIPFRIKGRRYVAYVSPHTATDIDIDGDGRLERVPLDEPVRGVSVYIRKVQPR